jgi:hypothetical protein
MSRSSSGRPDHCTVDGEFGSMPPSPVEQLID